MTRLPVDAEGADEEPVPPGTAEIAPPRPNLERLKELLEKRRERRDADGEGERDRENEGEK